MCTIVPNIKLKNLTLRPISCMVPKSRATVNYTLYGVEPHVPTRGVWSIATVANDSQSYLVASSI